MIFSFTFIKNSSPPSCVPPNPTTFVRTILLYSAYQRRYSGASIKIGHGVYTDWTILIEDISQRECLIVKKVSYKSCSCRVEICRVQRGSSDGYLEFDLDSRSKVIWRSTLKF